MYICVCRYNKLYLGILRIITLASLLVVWDFKMTDTIVVILQKKMDTIRDVQSTKESFSVNVAITELCLIAFQLRQFNANTHVESTPFNMKGKGETGKLILKKGTKKGHQIVDRTSSSRRGIPCLLSLDATCINGRISETKEVLLNASLVSETGTGVM